ncbi:glycerophosphoryl diester phosphodiesterase [Shewanella halifaxensis HAW-EB4]|uniref:Glycerophosphoryl diester phosphodiesterase n=1 Tax=Shewanella halifaxensis (strain HAW-EB4) TaxID=458817 RepID=B0TSH2_SHEHH|nr:glycerophosphodiester phosphodiesterase family protein [Shewanella halifaxensis]ABZ77926.1 glycerophosphoryl diester phosphodiesterase [Shewanella halifaxensis HAW-EB4]
MASYIQAPRRYYTVLLIALFALIGCQSTPEVPPAPAKVIPHALSHLPFDVKVDGADIVDIQLALGDRNLYLSDNGHIKMVSIAQCPLDISAHRGDFRLPESSDLAIASALFDNYNSVEIDVMQLGDGTWVNHHDSQTGRATVYYTGERYKLERMNFKQYAKLKLRQKGSNELLDRRPITAYEAFTTFAAYRSYDQLLNVEIKSEANGHELVELDNMLRQTIGQGGFYYSASDLEMLEKLRGINPRVYLGFVQGAHPTSVDKVTADLRRGAQNDDYYLDNQKSIEFAGKYGTKRYRSRYKNYASLAGIKKLNDKLGNNAGLHLDIRSFMQNTSVLNSAHRYGMKVYTYTINGTDYHQSQLKRLAKSKLPDGVIVDTTPYKICQKLFNPAVPKKRYQPLTASGKYIASLPSDADFDRFNEMLGYQQEGYYISLNSGLKAIASAKAKPKKVNKQTHANNPHGFPTIVDEKIETTNSKTIILTLPSNNND